MPNIEVTIPVFPRGLYYIFATRAGSWKPGHILIGDLEAPDIDTRLKDAFPVLNGSAGTVFTT